MAEPGSFARKAPHIELAFKHIFGDCVIDPDLTRALLPVYVHAHQSGRAALEPLALAVLTGEKWEWPWFESWHKAFSEESMWPYMWRHEGSDFPHIVRNSATGQLRQARVHILCHTLSNVITNIHNFVLEQEFPGERLLRLSPPTGDCEVEPLVAANYAPDMKNEDWRTWPPFFPGDRSHAKLIRRSIYDRMKIRYPNY